VTRAFTPRATVAQCAILVGGLGTRLGAHTASLPKPLMPCGDRPFLAWLMREMQRYGVEEFLLLAGHLSDEIEAAVDGLRRFLPRPVRIAISVEPHRAGTGGALHHARALLHERFFLCNGDSVFDMPLGRMLARAAEIGGHWVALRRTEDTGRSGVVTLEPDGERVAHFAHAAALGHPGLINAGIYLLERDELGDIPAQCSLEADILPRLALRGVVGTGWFLDIGVPNDLARAQHELPARLRRPALFLDRDGVLNHDHGWVGTRERYEWTTQARAAVRAACESGRHVFVVTNQSGIARGLYTEEDFLDLHRWILDEVQASGGTIDDLRFCPFHEDAQVARYRKRSEWRKPAPGMILDLVRAWELDPARCVLIGDQPSDVAAAEAAGVVGHLTRGGDLLEILARERIAA
jgi:D,D-heptose 1,7-bisphosphate phosphatase